MQWFRCILYYPVSRSKVSARVQYIYPYRALCSPKVSNKFKYKACRPTLYSVGMFPMGRCPSLSYFRDCSSKRNKNLLSVSGFSFYSSNLMPSCRQQVSRWCEKEKPGTSLLSTNYQWWYLNFLFYVGGGDECMKSEGLSIRKLTMIPRKRKETNNDVKLYFFSRTGRMSGILKARRSYW
jgi:hypothetical protein